jgi:hypothetical protein
MGEFIESYALVLHPHQNQYRYHWWLLDMPVGMIEHDSAQGAVSNVKEKPTLQIIGRGVSILPSVAFRVRRRLTKSAAISRS